MNTNLSPKPTGGTPSLDDLALLNAEIAALVEARIPLEPELRRLGTQMRGGAGGLATRLAERLEAGSDLAAAIEAEGSKLPEVYRAIVTAGLSSGNLPRALQLLADSSRRQADIRRITSTAMIYPALIVTLASLLYAVLLLGLLPRFGWIDQQRFGWGEILHQQAWVYWGLVVGVPGVAILGPLLWSWRASRAC